MDESDNSHWAERAIASAGTFEDLRYAIDVIRTEDDFALDGFERQNSRGGFAFYRPLVQETMLRMKERDPRLADVPTSDDSVDYMNWCDSARAIEESTAQNPNAGGGNAKKSWMEVQGELLRLREDGEAWTNYEDMAERIGCSTSTVHNAVTKSQALQNWVGRKLPMPKARSLGDDVTGSVPVKADDPAAVLPDNDVDTVFARLLKQAKPGERQELLAKTPDERRELVRLCQEQGFDQHLEDRARRGNCILGRKA